MDKQDEWEWIVTGHDPTRGRRTRAGERRARAHRRRLVRVLTVVMVVCALLGVFVFAWIMVERHEAGVEQARAAAMAVQTDPARDLSAQGDKYNRALASKPQVIGETLSQDGVSGDFSFASDTAYWGAVDYGDGVMGQLLIPRIHVDMPIRHGADASALDRGVGHLHGTSLPVGGQGTHAVLTGHTGEADKALFSRLDELEHGDVFTIRTGTRTLSYRVADIRTVLPRDTKALRIEPGRDLVTLVTCTPIFINSHRLLVTGERIPDGEMAAMRAHAPTVAGGVDPARLARLVALGVGVVGLPVAVCLSAHRHTGRVAHRRC